MKVAVLGAAGGIGQALSLLLKTQLPAGSDLALYDVAPVVPGVAVDLSHIPTAVKVTGHGKDDLADALTGADVVLIPAGMPRKPGMDRSDLFNINAGIVKNLIEGGLGVDASIHGNGKDGVFLTVTKFNSPVEFMNAKRVDIVEEVFFVVILQNL